jgi:hypothetical protein
MSNPNRQQHVRELAIAALRKRGANVRPGPDDAPGDDHLIDQDGSVYWLHNLQTQCSRLPVDDVAAAVEFSFDQRFAARDEPKLSDLSNAELYRQVRTRLQPPNTTGLVSMTYARPAFGGLVAELSRDLPTTVHTIGDRDVAGRDLDFLYEVGQRNTDAEPATTQVLDHDIVALHGESFYIASKALNVSHVVASVLGEAPLGVVFSVPHRSLLFVHRVGPQTVPAVSWLASATVGQTEQPAGGVISRSVYYWHHGNVQPVSRINPETKTIEILVEGLFQDAIEQVTSH